MLRKLFGKRDKPEASAPQDQSAARQTLNVAPADDLDAAASAQGLAGGSPSADVNHPLSLDEDDAGHSVPFAPTQPMGMHALDAGRELTPQQRQQAALAIVELHHQRIANTIRTLWGYKECSVYINKLIMAGGDGMGHARVGFHQDAVQAMLVLSDLHDAEFGPPDSIPATLG